MAYSKITAAQFEAAKAEVNAEMTRRNGSGSLTSYTFTDSATKGSHIKNTENEKVRKGLYNFVNADSSLLTQAELVKGSKMQSLNWLTYVNSAKFTANKAMNRYAQTYNSSASYYVSATDCRSGCSGTCISACTGLCTGSCTGSCSGGCSNCTGRCAWTCGAFCIEVCSDCSSGCDGECQDTCSVVCSTDTCKGNCNANCGESCKTSCQLDCTTGCTGGCTASCFANCDSGCGDQAQTS